MNSIPTIVIITSVFIIITAIIAAIIAAVKIAVITIGCLIDFPFITMITGITAIVMKIKGYSVGYILITIFVIWISYQIYFYIIASTFLPDILMGIVPWYIYMKSRKVNRVYAQLKEADTFTLGAFDFRFGFKLREKRKQIDEVLACSLAAKANPKQFKCLSDPSVIDAVRTLRSWDVHVTVKSNKFKLGFPVNCKITNTLGVRATVDLEKECMDFEELSNFVVKIKDSVYS